jgi:hypothetical protein
LAKPYLPVYRLQGQGQDGPLTVTFIGLDFSKDFFTNLLFTENPVEHVERVPFWRYEEMANAPSDIVIVHAARHLINKLSSRNAFVVPELVDHILNVQGDWQDVLRRFRKSVRKNELRLMRKYGYEYDVSYASQDFEEFYHQMYLPTMEARHGKLSSPTPISESYQYFWHGLLFKATRDGEWVSGMVCYPQQDVLIAKILGVRNADARLLHQGAEAALYYAGIHWSNQNGYKAINFLGSGTRLNGGLFQHKRKWGTTISVSPVLHRQIWIKVRRITPAVSRFLQENSFVTVGKNGKLHGLIIVDDPQNVLAKIRQGWENRFATPGLSSLLVHSIHDFEEETDAGEPGLVIPIPASSSLGDS